MWIREHRDEKKSKFFEGKMVQQRLRLDWTKYGCDWPHSGENWLEPIQRKDPNPASLAFIYLFLSFSVCSIFFYLFIFPSLKNNRWRVGRVEGKQSQDARSGLSNDNLLQPRGNIIYCIRGLTRVSWSDGELWKQSRIKFLKGGINVLFNTNLLVKQQGLCKKVFYDCTQLFK